MTACCVQKVPNVRFPHFLLSACPIILFMLVRSGRDVISSLVRLRLVPHDITARAPRHSCVLLVAIFTPNAFLFPKDLTPCCPPVTQFHFHKTKKMKKKETGIFTSPFPYISLRTSHRACPPVTCPPVTLGYAPGTVTL